MSLINRLFYYRSPPEIISLEDFHVWKNTNKKEYSYPNEDMDETGDEHSAELLERIMNDYNGRRCMKVATTRFYKSVLTW